MARPSHFEIPTSNPQKAIDFYTDAFGWEFTKWDGPMEYWLINTGEPSEPGINGGLLRRLDPDQPCVNTVVVADLDKTLGTIIKSGGTIALPKMPVPGIGWLAYCKDLDGHMIGVLQNDPAAK